MYDAPAKSTVNGEFPPERRSDLSLESEPDSERFPTLTEHGNAGKIFSEKPETPKLYSF